MKRVGIIGLGMISGYYADGLCDSYLSLVSVCDINENAPSRKIYEKLPFYTDFEKMIKEEKLEFVIVSTSPKSHYEIAKKCLSKGVSVICEKPAVLSMAEYDELILLAKENKAVFRSMYHFQKAFEVLEFNHRFDSSKISKIDVTITDPYTDNGEILKEKEPLCGAWLDSGVNALSMVKCWLRFEDVKIISTKKKLCKKTKLPLFVKVELVIDDIPVSITVDWQVGKSNKYSTLIYDNQPMILDSTNQKVIYQGTEYGNSNMERIITHYYNYFKNYKGESDEKAERKIQEVLLRINDLI